MDFKSSSKQEARKRIDKIEEWKLRLSRLVPTCSILVFSTYFIYTINQSNQKQWVLVVVLKKK